MATVKWTNRSMTMRRKLYVDGMNEFGETVAKKTARKIETLSDILSRWPETGSPEPLLRGLVPFYRSRHINKRFKIIYWYDEPNDVVVVEDIWDERRCPKNLAKRIK